MSGVGQPDQLPDHKTRVDGVTCIETSAGAYGSTNIITVPGKFLLRTEFGFDGALDPMLVGDEFDVVHHWQRVEDGATGRLPPTPGDTGQIVALATLSHITVNSGEFQTGPGLDLEIPPGFSAGTYRIFTHIHFHGAIAGKVAGFNDGLVLVVIA